MWTYVLYADVMITNVFEKERAPLLQLFFNPVFQKYQKPKKNHPSQLESPSKNHKLNEFGSPGPFS